MMSLFFIAGTSFKFLDQVYFSINFQQFKSCLTIFNCAASKFEIYVSKSTFFTNDFRIHFMCKFTQSF